MRVAVMQVQVSVFDAMTLKDKRRVIKSLKDRVCNRFNVSIAEVDYQDKIKTAILGLAMVANDSRFLDSAMNEILNFIRKIPQLTLIDYNLEIF